MAENSVATLAQTKPKPSVAFRWAVLVFISLAMFGNYYIYDSISPLAKVLSEQLGFSDANIGMLNAIYSIPNIIMVLIGGIVIDRIGTRKSTFIFACLCLIGSVITAATSELLIMLSGRFIFGIGAESLIVAVTTALAKWFRGKELGFAFGINLTIARLGSFAAFNSLTWAKPLYENWQWPLLLGVGFGVICVAGAVIYWILENSAEKKFDLGEAETEKISLRDIFKFGKSYWLIVALCFTFYSAVFPFQTFATKYFQEAHGASPELAGFLNSLLTLFAMIFTPLFGLLVDVVGRRSLFMMFGSALLIPVFLILAYVNVTLVVPMAVLGIAFSLIPAVMWPSVTYVVDQSKLGTAYGLMTMIQNIGLAGFNILLGWTNDTAGAGEANPAGYTPMLLILCALGFLGMLLAFLLRKVETGPGARGLETITAIKKAQ